MFFNLCLLGDVPEKAVDVYGGKAVNLARLMRLGFNVPAGFVIPVSIFEQWVKLGKKGMDVSIQAKILAAFDALQVEIVAVRSSAGIEDGKAASWAGQFESFLEVKRPELVPAIEKCFASCFSERARAYAAERSLDISGVGMAVIVQAMVASDVAGVAFSRHPVTHSEDVVYIEAVPGLGESLVSGAVTPDRWIVEKVSAEIMETTSTSNTLKPVQVVNLTHIVTKIEQKFGCAVDVEWCLKDGELYILQARPITTSEALITLRPTVKRDLSLFSVQAWQQGYGKYFLQNFAWQYPIFFHYDGTKVNFYHKLDDFNHFKKVITMQVIADPLLFQRLNTRFQENVRRLREEQKNAQLSMVQLADLIGEVMSFYMFVVSDAFVEACPDAWLSRHASEGILYEFDEQVEQRVRSLLEKIGHSSGLAHVMSVSEIQGLTNGDEPDWSAIELRRTGYILENDTLLATKDFKAYCQQQGFLNPELAQVENSFEVKGAVAYPGIAQGKVRLVLNREDIEKVEVGEVIVAIMTNVNYYSAMKRAVAVVTDEGGVTCHAAIAVRELKKVCVVGTKKATQTFHTGELVLVDGLHGIVKKLNQ